MLITVIFHLLYPLIETERRTTLAWQLGDMVPTLNVNDTIGFDQPRPPRPLPSLFYLVRRNGY